ncbi:MAG: PAS domain-containing sensor histidine kinase [Bacteroidota bacterium]
MPNRISSNPKEDALRLRALIDMATDAIITINRKGTIESANAAASKLFGYADHEMFGQNIKILMPEPYHSEHDGYLKRYQKTAKPHIIGIGREVQGQKKDGTIFPIRLAVSEVPLSDETIYTGIIHDISREKAATAQIEQMNLELEQKVIERTEELGRTLERMLQTNETLAVEMEQRREVERLLRARESELQDSLHKERELNELKSRFLSMASHEFKTPLSAVLSSIELIEMYQKLEDQPKREKHIERIKSAIGQLTDILNDFLSLTQIEQGRVEVKKRWVDLQAIISSSIEGSEGQLSEGQQVELELAASPTRIFSDPKLLKHILTNLISNAAKYSLPGKTITVRTHKEEATLVIEIIDQGIGIPKEDQKHIYDRFFRARNVENIKGTGLGLNIVQQYTQLLGGQLQFTSQLGVGSIFSVHLPTEESSKN